MKRTLLLLLYFLTTYVGLAQLTVIPDTNFEQALIDEGYDDVLDGSVLTANIQNITFLNLTNDPNFNINENEIGLGITNLTGIKDFISLEILWVQGNNLVELDLEGLNSILDIRAFYNDLENLNITGLINLEIIGLNVNNLTGINVSTNTSLRIFDVAQNDLLGLNISGLANLTNMNVQDNTQLSCIQVENAARATSLNNNTSFKKNGITTFSNTCPPIYTQIPDRNFEQSLLDQNIDSEGGIPDGLVLTSDVENLLNLNISGKEINDLTGLEAFASLEILDVSNNNLNALELENLSLVEIYANECNLGGKPIRFQNTPPSGAFLTNVTTLELQNNSIGSAGSTISFGGIPNVTYLDVSDNNFGTLQLNESTSIEVLIANNCPNLSALANLNLLNNLESLGASFSGLSLLDVGQNSQLSFLNISGNTLTSLDLSNNNLIVSVYAGDNDLASISLPTTTALSELYLENNTLTALNVSIADQNLFDLDVTGNTPLGCIQVTNVTNAEAQGGWQKDTTTEYRTDCNVAEPVRINAILSIAGPEPYSVNEDLDFEIRFFGQYDETPVNPTYSIDYNTMGSTATPNVDFTTPDISVTVNNGPPVDAIVTFSVPLDYYADPNEKIVLNFPANPNFEWVNANTDGSISFEININDIEPSIPLEIIASLENAGEEPYSVTEGNSFNLNFNIENPNFQTIGQSLTFPFTPNTNTADFTVNATQGSFTVNNNVSPEGSLTFNALTDANPNENESININLPQPTDYFSWVGASGDGSVGFEVAIEDNVVQNNLLKVEASLGGGEGGLTNYSILEGNFLSISFNILSTVTEDQEFPVVYQIEGSAQTEDYILPPNPGTLATSTFTSYAGGLSFQIINDFPSQELGETIIITLPKPTSGYEWVNAEADGSLRFEINITDSSSYNEPNFEVELIGNTEFVDGIYYITEGDALEFWIESNTLNNDQGITYELTTEFVSISGNAELGIDYNTTTLPLQFQVSNNENPDTKISIETIDDIFRNEPKDIILTIRKNDEIPFADATNDVPIRYFIRVNDNDNVASSISAILDNTGSLEGGANDVFTLSLINSDDTPYLAEENLTFDISFSPIEGPNGEKAADIGDFIPVNGETQIRILQGFSEGKIEVELPPESGVNQDDIPEYYLATLTQNTTVQNFTLSEPLLVKILDPGTKFEIYLTAFTTNPINNLFKGNAIFSNPSGCCPTYSIEEGASFKIGFEAEKGVPFDSKYTVNTNFAEIGALGDEGTVTAEEGVDYQNKNPNNTATYDSKSKIPDNVLQIDIFSDQEEQINGTEVIEDEEYFFLSIALDENDKEKYTLVNIREASGLPAFPNAAEIFITQVIPVVIPELSYEVTEIDSESNIVRVKVSVDRENFTGLLEVDYELSGSAIDGNDYEIIGSRNIVFDGNKDAYIDIKILNDNDVENEEQIIITLLDDRGYSVSNSSNRAVVTILQNDQDLIDYTITLSAEPSQITEIEGSNQGIFTVTVTPDNDPDSNLLVNDVFVNYEFVDNGEPNPAIEGLGNDFIQSGNGQIIFERGGPNTKEIIVTALADPNIGVESVETITLSLRTGSQYSAEKTNPVSLEIISTEVDTSRLLSTDLQVTVATNTCANTNEGDIIIKNNSGLDIWAEIASENKSILIEKTKENTIKNLPAGRHLVTFSFVDETVDLLPPSFEVFIAELSGTNLLGKQVNLNSKTASLKISGSKKYTIVNGNNEHYFEFNDFIQKTVSIPISNGINDILIKGEAACQGVVKTQVFLNEFVVFPNPTESFFSLSGFLLEEDAFISISDMSGKSFLNTTRKIIANSVRIDLSKYPPGLYYGRIKTESGQDLRFKILKD